MTITITTKKLIESFQVLRAVANLQMPPGAGFQIGHAILQAAPIEQLFQKARIEQAAKHAKKDDAGNPIVVPKDGDTPEHYDIEDTHALEKAMEEIFAAPVELAISPVTVESLGDTKMPAAFYAALDWLIVAEVKP